MKVLVTGATGLIGKVLAQKLVERGHSIVALSRRPDEARRELPFPAEIFSWEGGGALVPPAALEGIDAVIHLAGESVAAGRWTSERKKRIRDSRVDGTRSLVRSLQASPSATRCLKTFVMGSAIGYYGDRPGDETVAEHEQAGDDFLAQVCVDWEKAGAELCKDPRFASVRTVAVRTGIVLAREGGALQKMLPVFVRGVGGKMGRGQQWMSWIHIDDIVGLFLHAVDPPVDPRNDTKALSDAVNGVAPHPARNESFSNALAKSVGKSLFLPVPEAVLRATLGEMSTALLTGVRASSKKAEESGYVFKWPDLNEALADLCAPERDGEHELFTQQWVARPVTEVFKFFADEKNLEAVTPKFLGFSVQGMSTPAIRQGTLIDYRLKVHGIPLRWRTEIEDWAPSERFIDRQLKGPYKKWRHVHEFTAFAGGTLMSDRVRYRLPLGGFGDVVASWKVGSDVRAIFAFRRKKIAEVFP